MKPAEHPNMMCPFTGEPIQIVQVGGSTGGILTARGSANVGFFARCESKRGGWQSQIFRDREELLFFLSTRDGVEPAFSKHAKIEVKELVPPVDTGATEESLDKELTDDANAEADRILSQRRKRRGAAVTVAVP